MKDHLLQEVIIGYRALITDRYKYELIKTVYDLPPSFDEARVNLFKNYFLNYIYPPPEKRDELNATFEHLDDYIKKPEKLLRLLIDSSSLLFKYGRHLPKILNAGIKALRSYRTASRFEQQLCNRARKKNILPPFDSQKIQHLISLLPKEKVDIFIKNNHILFDTIHDRVLVKKIAEVLEHLISKMKKRPKIYTENEINGLNIGLQIIKEGNAIFDKLNQQEQKELINFVAEYEQLTIDQIFKNKK